MNWKRMKLYWRCTWIKKSLLGTCQDRDATWRGLVGTWRLIRDWSYQLTFRQVTSQYQLGGVLAGVRHLRSQLSIKLTGYVIMKTHPFRSRSRLFCGFSHGDSLSWCDCKTQTIFLKVRVEANQTWKAYPHYRGAALYNNFLWDIECEPVSACWCIGLISEHHTKLMTNSHYYFLHCMTFSYELKDPSFPNYFL